MTGTKDKQEVKNYEPADIRRYGGLVLVGEIVPEEGVVLPEEPPRTSPDNFLVGVVEIFGEEVATDVSDRKTYNSFRARVSFGTAIYPGGASLYSVPKKDAERLERVFCNKR